VANPADAQELTHLYGLTRSGPVRIETRATGWISAAFASVTPTLTASTSATACEAHGCATLTNVTITNASSAHVGLNPGSQFAFSGTTNGAQVQPVIVQQECANDILVATRCCRVCRVCDA
jgi:hypothetical protein